MTPKLAQAVDPIFLHVLDLLERINRNESTSPQDDRLRIRALIDQAEAIVGGGGEWDLAKYALVAWIDEMLVDAPWAGSEWWSNNVLEVEIFKTRNCSEQFYVKAQEAATLPTRDALEVFYVGVLMGFRGMYRDPRLAKSIAEARGLPTDLETWVKQTSLSIRLGQGRPSLAAPGRDLSGAPPLRGKGIVVWPWTTAMMLAASTIVCLWFWFNS